MSRANRTTYAVDSLIELADLEELVSFGLVSVDRRELVNLSLSQLLSLAMNNYSKNSHGDLQSDSHTYLGSSNVQKTQQVGVVGVVGKTLVQDLLSLDELALEMISDKNRVQD